MQALLLLLLCDVAFVDVNVVPMDAERVLERVTVLVRGDTIAAVGKDVEIPEGATRIDGRGRWLMPGLADMHVHNWYEEEHVLFLANGVTTIRNMWGAPMHLRWQREIAAGERLGPTIHTTGPILDGAEPVWKGSAVVTTPAEARAEVVRQKAAGYEAVKVYDRLAPDVYEAIVAAARERGMRVEGHVPAAVGVEGAVDTGQDSIEHLHLYVPRDVADRARDAGVPFCPTVVVYARLVKPAPDRPELRFVPPRLRATWKPYATPVGGLEGWLARARLLHGAGCRLLLGTDAGSPFVVPGFSVHEELRLLCEAGLSPYEALVSATRAPAEYLGGPSGVVAPGNRADLVLLEANPLADVANAGKRAGVMVRGRWLAEEELRRMLEEVVASYAKPKERFAGLPPLPAGRAFHYDVLWNGAVVGEERFSVAEDGVVHVQQVNDPPWGTTRTWTLGPGDATDHVNAIAFYVHLRPRLAGLAPDAEHKLRIREAGRVFALAVRRVDERTFELRTHRRDGRHHARLVYDEAGIPLELVQEFEQGDVRWRRR